jgi:hypothetical protein
LLIDANFDEVSDQVVAGTYSTRIVGAEAGEWSTGTKFIKWTLETIEEENPKNNGRRIFHRTPTHGKGAFRLQEIYRAATGEVLSGGFDTEQLLSKEIKTVVVDGKDKEGNPSGYPEVKSVSVLN